MRCGNCKGNHAAVSDVRACYGARPSVPYPSRAAAVPVGASASTAAAPAPAPSPRPALDFSNVPVGTRDGYGHYAVELDGEVRFFRVDKPTASRWAGWAFVKHEVSEQRFPVVSVAPTGRPSWKAPALQPYIEALIADPQKAAIRYGELFTRCALCNTRLTDKESIARGIGPVCASNAGW